MSDNWGAESVAFFEIDIPRCEHDFGVAPCAAALGVTGEHKCFKSRQTCQDPDNYSPAVRTLRISTPQQNLLAYGPSIPCLVGWSTAPGAINLGGLERSQSALGLREVLTVHLKDLKYDDFLLDDYRLERGYDTYERGTLWGKFIARHPFYSSYKCRMRTGYVGQDLADMAVREYIVATIEGPNESGVTLVAKDIFSKLEAKKAVAPVASQGSLDADITGSPATFTVSPAGIGDIEYADITALASGYVCIGEESILATRVADVFTVVSRAALGSTQADHKQEDLVQLVLTITSMAPYAITAFLLLGYTTVPSAAVPVADWAAASSEITELYTAHITKPTPVEKLIGELEVQAGFTIYPDTATGIIKFAALRGAAAPVIVENDTWIVRGTFSHRRRDDKRVSQVWVYYGQINPVRDLEERGNFHSVYIAGDADAEGPLEYDDPAVLEVFSRWMPQFGRSFAQRAGNRLRAMYRDPPIEADFSHHASRAGEIELARYFQLRVPEIQDELGDTASTTMALVQSEAGQDVYAVRAQQVRFDPTPVGGGETVVPIENNAANLNLREIWDSLYAEPTDGQQIRFVVEDGVTVGSTSTTERAIRTGDWEPGILVTLTVESGGRIEGHGGKGADSPPYVADASIDGPGLPGQDGGDALLVEVPISIDNQGEIWAGAGGGGSGALFIGAVGVTPASGAGGGGAGDDPGAAGITAMFSPWNGAPGTPDAGGDGGVADGSSGNGGDGGDPGEDGHNGGSAFHFLHGTSPGGTGGTKGDYIVGNGLVTWINTGDRRGGVA